MSKATQVLKALSPSTNESMVDIMKFDTKDYATGVVNSIEDIIVSRVKAVIDPKTLKGQLKFVHIGWLDFSLGSENFTVDLGSKSFHVKSATEEVLKALKNLDAVVGNYR